MTQKWGNANVNDAESTTTAQKNQYPPGNHHAWREVDN